MRAIAVLAALVLGLASSVAVAQPIFPALTGRVVDQAAVIPDADEPALDAKLAAIEQQTGRQVVVATIADMQGYPLSDYGYQLGRAWGIGEKKANNGVVLFVAPNEPAGKRGPRIEVGYGLEPVLTDAVSHVIAWDIMTPMLKKGDITGAFNAGVDEIAKQLRLPPEEAAKRAQAMERQNLNEEDIAKAIFILFIVLFFVVPMVARLIFGRRRRGKRWRHGPVVIWGGPSWGGGSSGSSWSGGSSWGGGGGFSGGGGSFGGGGASGGW